MTEYWQELAPSLENEVEGAMRSGAIACAKAVFATFLAAAEHCVGLEPAR